MDVQVTRSREGSSNVYLSELQLQFQRAHHLSWKSEARVLSTRRSAALGCRSTLQISNITLGCRHLMFLQDNGIHRKTLGKRLSLDGYEVFDATNVQECLDMIELDRAFHCVVMDIQYVKF